jgi:diguanylate cyclase (GGDEF)-like protein
MRFTSIKFKIALTATAGFLCMVLVIATMQMWHLQKSIMDLLAAQQFSLVTAAATDLDEKLNIRAAALTHVANEIPEAVKRNPAALQKLIRERPALKASFDRIFVFSATGKLLASAPDFSGGQSVNVSDRGYFQDTLSKRASVISAPFRGKLKGQPAVMITAPILDARGDVVAILGGSLELLERNFLGEIGTEKVGKTGYYYVVAKGPPPIMVSHPDKKRVMTAAPDATQNQSLALALAGFEGTLEGINSTGLHGLFSFKSLKSTAWVLATVLPAVEAFAPIHDMQKKTLLIAISVSLFFAPLIWVVVYRLLDPLKTLATSMREFQTHGFKSDSGVAELPILCQDEIGALTGEFNVLIRERQQAERQLEHMARHDSLTGLPNRALFSDRLARAAARNERSGKPFAVMYLDIDHFKSINDTLGHAAGDALLVAFAAMLSSRVRSVDTVARLGGDEFVVLLEELGSLHNAEMVAQKIVEATRTMPQAATRITTSLGVAYVENALKRDLSGIVKQADAAMYEAKTAGRDRYCLARAEPVLQPEDIVHLVAA